ncbi:endonuclease/exonuclease/phosphatase family protein [Azospirillum sp. HJ39]|uniref:endonuclease/exonuclease/phosphatase family protein n=1 Tax=Azospirillum sp. HJ39 TaxID=3159496 RepID=UPI003555C231
MLRTFSFSLLVLMIALGGFGPTRADVVLGSWNIRTLATNGTVFPDDVPRTDADFALLRTARDRLGADVIALQEVTSPHAVAKVFPASDYVICFSGQYDADEAGLAPWYPPEKLGGIKPTCYGDANAPFPDPTAGAPRKQYVAVVVRRASGMVVESVRDVPELGLTVEEENRDTKQMEIRSVRWGLEATLAGDRKRFRLLAVHLKSGCNTGELREVNWNNPTTWSPNGRNDHACMTLARQMAPLRSWLARARADAVPFVIAGDMNRRIDIEAADEQTPDFWPVLTGAATPRADDDQPLARVPEGEKSKKACWPEDDKSVFVNAIDYFIFDAQFRPADWGASYTKLRYADMVDPVTSKKLTKKDDAGRTSDHCPFSVRLK